MRAEHGEEIGILLVLYAIQIYMRLETQQKYEVDIWIDNTEVLTRGQRGETVSHIKDYLVLDYDLLHVMAFLQSKMMIPIIWNKVDSHSKTTAYKEGQTSQGGEHSIRLNEVMDMLILFCLLLCLSRQL